MGGKTMERDGWISEETRAKVVAEMRQLKLHFKNWLRTEDGRAVFRNLFAVFSQPPSANAELEFARFAGRMEVLNYIMNHGEILGGTGND
jgi:hypothetical protein